MLVSTHMRVPTEANARVQSRKSTIEDDEDRRVFERSDDNRRQGGSARRQRQNTRPREVEDRSGETLSASPVRVLATRREAAPKPVPFSALSRAAEFWSLLGAVAVDNAEQVVIPETLPPVRKELSLQELLAKAIVPD